MLIFPNPDIREKYNTAMCYYFSFMHLARNLCNPKLFKILPIVSLDNQCFLCCLFECQENLVRLLQSAPLHTPQLANVKKEIEVFRIEKRRSMQFNVNDSSFPYCEENLLGLWGLCNLFGFQRREGGLQQGKPYVAPFPFGRSTKPGDRGRREREVRKEDESRTRKPRRVIIDIRQSTTRKENHRLRLHLPQVVKTSSKTAFERLRLAQGSPGLIAG